MTPKELDTMLKSISVRIIEQMEYSNNNLLFINNTNTVKLDKIYTDDKKDFIYVLSIESNKYKSIRIIMEKEEFEKISNRIKKEVIK